MALASCGRRVQNDSDDAQLYCSWRLWSPLFGIWHHAGMSQELELFHWWFDHKTTGKRRRTLYAMDRETAIELYGNVEPDQPTRVVRTVYQLGEAPHAQMPPQLQVVEVGNPPGTAPRH